MTCIRPRIMQVCPAEKASRPVSFPSFVILAEFVVVNWPIAPVQRVCPIVASIVSKTRCNRYSCTTQEQCAPILSLRMDKVSRRRCSQKRHNGFSSTLECICRRWNYRSRRQLMRQWYTQAREFVHEGAARSTTCKILLRHTCTWKMSCRSIPKLVRERDRGLAPSRLQVSSDANSCNISKPQTRRSIWQSGTS